MTVVLQRAWSDERATIGMLTVYGVCHDPLYTLENPLRETTADSRIPAGEYNCIPYSGLKYKDVYLVENVPGRSGILFHWGNYERDTEGCILVGLGSGMMKGEPSVAASRPGFQAFKNLIGDNNFKLIVAEARNV